MAGVTIKINMGKTLELAKSLRAMHGFKTGLYAAGTYLKGRLAVYPPASHRAQPFVSDHQRRGFFAKLKAGEIDVPYKRGMSPGSQKLGQSWSVSVSGLSVTVGTAASYAKLVQGEPGDQARYHAGTGWKRIDEVARDETPRAIEIVEEHVKKMAEYGT